MCKERTDKRGRRGCVAAGGGAGGDGGLPVPRRRDAPHAPRPAAAALSGDIHHYNINDYVYDD